MNSNLLDTAHSDTAPNFNVKNAEYVHFHLSQEEYQAYSQIARMGTVEELSKGGYVIICKDLQSTLSVKVYPESSKP
jgi:hypothetical protein